MLVGIVLFFIIVILLYWVLVTVYYRQRQIEDFSLPVVDS